MIAPNLEIHPDDDQQDGRQEGTSTRLPNPYVGPRPLNSTEKDKLGGRSKEISQLLNLLIAERIVFLHAPSGAGKTSLIDAGLRPRLEEMGKFWVSPLLRVNKLPNDRRILEGSAAGQRYVYSVLQSLEEAVKPGAKLPQEELAQYSLSKYLDERLADVVEGRRVVLIFDQFEEILTVDPYDVTGKHAFFARLGKALKDRTRWALFAARADYLYGFERYQRPIPTRLNNTFELRLLEHDPERPPGEDPAVQAIQTPACTVTAPNTDEGIRFDDDAAEYIVTELSKTNQGRITPYVEPVLLQVVCRRLWNRLRADGKLDDGDISLPEAKNLTDIDEALALYYAECVADVARSRSKEDGRGDRPAGEVPATTDRDIEKRERVIREWVGGQLINESEKRTTVIATGDSAAFAEDLVQVHLIRKEDRRGEFWYELAHDRLVKPVLDDNAKWFAANLSLLQRQAREWNEATPDQARNLLLRDQDLELATQWAKAHDEVLRDYEREFLQISQAAEAERQKEIAAAQREARIAKRLLYASVALLLLLALALAAGVFAALRSSQDRIEGNLASANNACEQVEGSVQEDRLDKCREAVELATIHRLDDYDDVVERIRDTIGLSLRQGAIAQQPDNPEQLARACLNGLVPENGVVLTRTLHACDMALAQAGAQVQDADLLVADAISLDVLNDLCTYRVSNRPEDAVGEVLDQACLRAADVTYGETRDLIQVNVACQNALIIKDEMSDDSGAIASVPVTSCETAIELVTKDQAGDLLQLNLACQDGQLAGLEFDVVRPACEQATMLAEGSNNLVQVNLACQNALGIELDSSFVEGACNKAAILAAEESAADLVQVNLACENALSALLGEAIRHDACLRAVMLVDESTEDLVQVNLACQNALVAGIATTELASTCERAIPLAKDSNNLEQVNQACDNGLIAGLTADKIGPACQQAATLAQASDNLGQVNQACDNGLIAGLTADRIEPACQQAATLAQASDNLGQVNQACSNALLVSLDDVFPVCSQAVEVAANSENLVQVNQACENSYNADLNNELVAQVCSRAVSLTENWAGLVQINAACQNARIVDLGDDRACQQAVDMSELSEDIVQVDIACRNGPIDNKACERLKDLVAGSSNLIKVFDLCVEGRGESRSEDLVNAICQSMARLARAAPESEERKLDAISYVCREGTTFGLSTLSVLLRCQQTARLAAREPDAPDRLSNLCAYGLDIAASDYPVTEARIKSRICNRALASAEPAESLDAIRAAALLCLLTGAEDLPKQAAAWRDEACELVKDKVSLAAPEAKSQAPYPVSGQPGAWPPNRDQDPIATGVGDLSSGQLDTWPFGAVKDDIVTITMTRSTRDLDPQLMLFDLNDPEAGPIAQDDDSGGDLNALIREQPLPETSVYVVVASGIGESAGAYSLTLNSQAGQKIGAGQVVSDTISPEMSSRWFFRGSPGQVASIWLDHFPPTSRAPSGLYLTLLGPDGTPLAEDTSSEFDYSSTIDRQILPEDGLYVIEVRSGEFDSGEYGLALELDDLSDLVQSATDPYQIWDLCQTGLVSGLPLDIIRQACEPATDLAADDPNFGLRFCAYRDTGVLTELISDVCNAALAQATPLDLDGTTVTDGVLEPDSLELWTFNGEAGQVVDIAMDSLDGELDPYLTLSTLDGEILTQDDDSGEGFNSRINDYTLPLTDTYLIQASGYGGSSGPYALSIEVDSFKERVDAITDAGEALDYCQSVRDEGGATTVEIEYACARAAELALAEAEPLETGRTTDLVLRPGSSDYWLVSNEGEEGLVMTLAMSRDPTSEIDPILRLYTADGLFILQNRDRGTFSRDALIDGFVLKGDRQYLIAAGDSSGVGGDYSLSLQLDPLEDRLAEELAEPEVNTAMLNMLCWYGTLAGYAQQVLEGCERGVERAEETDSAILYSIRDSRGLALAITGDTRRAIEDFAYYAARTSRLVRAQAREEWIAELQNGGFPFTEEALDALLTE